MTIHFHIIYLQIVDAVLSNANESLTIGTRVIDANTNTISLSDSTAAAALVSVECCANEVKQNIQIPTAIVKPKYQKAAFDERQLPIIACMDRNQPWYDRECAVGENSTTKTNHTRKVIQLPECERKVKKRLKHHEQNNTVKSAHTSNADNCNHNVMINVRSGNKCSATKEQTTALDTFEKDTNSRRCADRKSSTVAIVQPRKKEKMDERKLMETIVQMQIKKNSMDNRNNNQRNGNRNAPLTTVKTSTMSMSSELPKDASGTFRLNGITLDVI